MSIDVILVWCGMLLLISMMELNLFIVWVNVSVVFEMIVGMRFGRMIWVKVCCLFVFSDVVVFFILWLSFSSMGCMECMMNGSVMNSSVSRIVVCV